MDPNILEHVGYSRLRKGMNPECTVSGYFNFSVSIPSSRTHPVCLQLTLATKGSEDAQRLPVETGMFHSKTASSPAILYLRHPSCHFSPK